MILLRKFVTLTNRLTRPIKEDMFRNYPSDNFEEKHLINLQSLKDREALLKRLPSNAIVAEIGVNEGDFSEQILTFCNPQKLVLIDVWSSKRYHAGLFEKVKNRFALQLADGKIEIMRDLSFGAIAACRDNYFDWVYLDTDHTFNTTQRELDLLRPKMKKGGIIAGHDYIIGNWNAGNRYGVIEAVRAFCIKYNWELIFLTHELHTPPSFAIREII